MFSLWLKVVGPHQQILVSSSEERMWLKLYVLTNTFQITQRGLSPSKEMVTRGQYVQLFLLPGSVDPGSLGSGTVAACSATGLERAK